MNLKPLELLIQILLSICCFQNAMSRRAFKNHDSSKKNLQAKGNGYNRSSIQITESLPSNATKTWQVCLTPGCVQTANNILNQMDSSIDPCDDFYHYACGNFIKNSVIPDDKPALTQFLLNSQVVTQHVKSIVDEPIRDDELKSHKIAKKLYRTCMDTKKIEKTGLEEVKEILHKLGGYPLLEGKAWNKHSFHWMKSLFKLRRMGLSINYFFDVSIGPDLKNSTQKVLILDTGSLGLKTQLLIKGMNEKEVKLYYQFMVDIAVMFGADRIRAANELHEVVEMQIRMAKWSLTPEERRRGDNVYHRMTIKELELRHRIPWLTYINTILAPDAEVTNEEVVIVTEPEYLRGIDNILASTPKRVQANYIMSRVLRSTLSYLTEAISNREFEFLRDTSGTKAKQARWKKCVRFANSNVPFALGGMYVKRYFNHQSKITAEAMVQDIKSEFIRILEEVDWMNEETRRKALDKAHSMMFFVGYPEELVDERRIEEYYRDLKIDKSSFLMSGLKITLFATKKSIKEFRDPISKTDWRKHSHPTVVNAFYSTTENGITLPAGILQGTFFNADRPKYMNYGSIGFIIGHELTHGFDDEGKQFDENGNLAEWWDPKTKQAFNKKAQCIVEQYGNYSFPELGLKVNGILTQGENIADNGGIKESYRAYQKWVKHNGPEPQLPGLDYSPNQMFWISVASNWCAKETEEHFKLALKTASHSPYLYRVNGVMSNSWEFSNDWKCPLGSKMNPVEKCTVW